MQRAFESWSAAVGADWTTHLAVRREVETEDGPMVRGEYFMSDGDARRAAGLE